VTGPCAGEGWPTLAALLVAVRDCRACAPHLPLGPRPVLQAHPSARILVVGQAPGLRVHTTGVPWDDASGDRLRAWMGVDRATFLDASKIAIVPIGFCYPGRGAGGDRPPRRECAPRWHPHVVAKLPRIELTLLIGRHAHQRFLGARRKPTLAETTAAWSEYAPRFLPLPHPSPRNQPWFKRHAWFERDVIPHLRARVRALVTAKAACRSSGHAPDTASGIPRT